MFENWNVTEDAKTPRWPGAWVLTMLIQRSAMGQGWPSLCERVIDIGPLSLTWEQAVDAATEFMDRLRTGAIPKTITEPAELMEMCVRNMRRQR